MKLASFSFNLPLVSKKITFGQIIVFVVIAGFLGYLIYAQRVKQGQEPPSNSPELGEEENVLGTFPPPPGSDASEGERRAYAAVAERLLPDADLPELKAGRG